MNRDKVLLRTKVRRLFGALNRVISLTVTIAMVINLMGFQGSIAAAGGSFSGYNENLVAMSSSEWLRNGSTFNGSVIEMDEQGADTTGLAVYDIDVSSISNAIGKGGLEINFSADSFIADEGEGLLDVCSAEIAFSTSDSASNAISTTVVERGIGSPGSSIALTSGASIPAGTLHIIITLKSVQAGEVNSAEFSSVYLSIDDTQAPGISVDYNTAWTNSDIEVTVTASDADSGIEGIYDSTTYELKSSSETYVFTATENSSYSFLAQDYAGYSSEEIGVEITNIDKNAPTASLEITLSTGSWSPAPVTFTLSEFTATSGESPEKRQYKLGEGEWTDYSGEVTVSAEGSTVVYARVVDEAGNSSETTSVTAYVDTQAPSFSSLDYTPSQSGGATVTAIASDASSGVVQTLWAAGNVDISSFPAAGTEYTDTFSVTDGGIYTVYAKDNAGNQKIDTITVNTYPTIQDISDKALDEDHELEVTFTVSDRETADGDLTVSATSADTSVIPNPACVNSGGSVTLTIDPLENKFGGPITITVSVNDGGLTSQKNFDVTVNPVNDKPIANDDSGITVEEDSSVQIDVLANDNDIESVGLTINSVGTASKGTVTIAGDGKSVTYTPNANANGADSFTYTVTDGADISNTATVSLTITEANDAPTAVNDALVITEDNNPLIDVIDNDLDDDLATTDDEVLTVIAVSTPSHGSAAIEGNKIRFNPPENWSGVSTFTYTIKDRQNEQSTATVEVTVETYNDEPTISGFQPTYEINEDQTGFEIVLQISDVETPLENLMFQASSDNTDVLSNSNIVISGLGDVNANVTIAITPNANKYGEVTLTFKASDGFAVTTETAHLTVNSVNDAPEAGDDELYYTEDSALLIDMDELISNDTDIDGDDLYFYGIETYPSQGTLVETDHENNIWTFTPGTDDTGNITFTYSVSDSSATDIGTVTLYATSVNDKPTIVLNNDENVYECNEDENSLPLYFTIDDVETSPDYLILAVGSSNETIVSSDHIAVTHGTEGVCNLVISPNGDQNGTITITITVSDGSRLTTVPFEFEVIAVQDAPVAVNDSYSVMERSKISFDPTINDRDADGEAINIDTYSQPEHGTLTIEGNVFTYTPSAGYTGPDSFTYDISDGHETAQATVSITVNDFSSVPHIEPIANQYIYEDNSTGALEFSITDEDIGDSLTVSAVSDNTELVPDSSENIVISDLGGGNYTINVIPAANMNGKVGITLTVEDLAGNTDTTKFYVYVFPVNDGPVAVDDTVVTDEDTTSDVIDMLANDIDAETDTEGLSVLSVSSPAHGRVTQDASLDYHYVPDHDYHGTDSFTYIMTDGESTATATVYVTINSVNDAPYAENNWITVSGTPGASKIMDILYNDYDGDEDTVYLHEIVSGPTYGTAVMNPDGTVTYTRDADLPDGYNWADSFIYKIRDREDAEASDVLYDTATVYIDDQFYSSLNAYNRYIEKDEDSEPFYISLSIGNPTGNPLTITTSTPTLGAVTEIDNTGKILFAPNLNANGSETITYTVTDGESTDTAYIYLYLVPVNDAPYFITSPESVVFDEDTTAGLPETTGVIEFTYDDDDQEHDISDLTFTIKATPDDGESIAIADAGIESTYTQTGATITITPLEDMYGTGYLTVNVSDGLDKAEIIVPYSVLPVNDIPNAPDYTRYLPEDTSVDIDLVNVTSDIDGDIVTMTVEDGDGPSNGSVSVDGEVATYSPNADYYGNDSFQYTLNDGNGGISTGTVYLVVENVNDPPVISGLSYYYSTLEDVAKDVIFTASDNEGDSTSLTFNTSNSTLVPVDNIDYSTDGDEITITVTPAQNEFGTVVITANIFDGTDTVSRDFQLFVKSVNDTPIAEDDEYSINEDVETVFTPTSNDSDVEDTNLEIFEISETQQGAIVVNNGDGTITYTPPEDFFGTDTFTYIISDDHDSHAQATVTVNIASINDAPDAVDDSVTTDEDVEIVIDLLENDSDVEEDTLAIIDIDRDSATLAASITDNGDGTITYVPSANVSGTDTFTYTVSDGQPENSTASATVTVEIVPVNDEPEATKSDGYTGEWEFYEDTVGVFGIDVTDVETASQYLLVTMTSSNQYLIPDTSIDLSGTFEHKIVTLTPIANRNGTLTLTVEMSDGVNTSYQTFDVTVLAINDQPTISQDDVETDEDTSVSGTATARDVETPTEYLEFSHDTTATGPLHGSVTVNTDGTWTYEPDADYNGPDVFTIKVDDTSKNDNSTNTVEVSVTINAQNDDPEPDEETAQTDEDTPVTIDVLAGDTDIDADTDLNQDPEYDPESEILSIKEDGFAGLDHGTAEISEGQVVFTPSVNWYGTEEFTYTVEDSHGGEAQASITVTVNPVNDAPTLSNNTGMTLYEGATKTVTNVMLKEGDPDDSGSGITYTITSITQNGQIKKDGVPLTVGGQFTQSDIDGGDIAYTHDGSETVEDSFGFSLADGGEDAVEPVAGTFDITIIEVNDAPVISSIGTQTILEDESTEVLSFTVTDIDSDNSQLLVTATSNNSGLVIPADNIEILDGDGTNRTVQITPIADKNGTATITLTVSDKPEEGATRYKTDTTSFVLNVTPVDDAPDAQPDTYTIHENDGAELIDVTANDDVDFIMEGDTLTIVSIDSHTPSVGSSQKAIDSGDEREKIEFTPDADWSSKVQVDVVIAYTMQDSNGDTSSSELTVHVMPENDAPTINQIADQTINEDNPTEALTLTVADEEDDDSTLTIDKSSSNKSLIKDENIVLTHLSGGDYEVVITPEENQNGNSDITISVTDADGVKVDMTFTVTVTPVNDAPSDGDDNRILNEDTETIFDNLLSNDDVDEITNPALEDLIITQITQPANGTAVLSGDGKSVTYTPDENYYGADSAGDEGYDDDSFTYTVKDAGDQVNTFTVNIEIEPVNDAPVITATFGDQTINEGTPSKVLSFTVNDVDDDDSTLTVTGVSSRPLLIKNSAIDIQNTGGEDRTVQVTPNGKWNGVSVITLTVKDDDLAWDATESVYEFTVTVDAVNEAPVANDDNYDSSAGINEDELATLDVLANDTDGDLATNPEEEHLTIVEVSQVDTSQCTVEIINEGTALSIKSAENWNGTTTFDYKIEDAWNAESTATVTVYINQVNDDPVAANDTGSAQEDNAATIDVLANDTDIDQDTTLNKDGDYPPEDEKLSVIDPEGFSGVQNGTATVNGDGDVVFTPTANWHGTETFTYTVNDSHGGSDTASVTVTINAVNDLPVANDDTYTIDEDAQDEWMFTVLANDTDDDKTSGVDTETLTIVSVADVDAAVCTVDIVDDTKILLNPIEHWNGTTTFTYTIEDLSEATTTATVTVNINQVNDNPEAVDDTGSAQEDNAATIDVLNNDTDKDQDTDLNKDTTYPPSGEVLSVDPDGFSGVEHGTATVNGEGDVVFTPADDWHGVETFTYTVKDARGGSATADVTVTITAVNDLPVAKDDTYTIDEDAQDEWTFTVLSNDTDADKTSGVDPTETMTIVSVAGVDTDVCTVDIVDDTQILFNPIEHWNGTTTFTYTIEDLSEATATATVTVNINQVNDNPEAVDDTGSAQEDNAATIDVLNNDTDKDQDTDLNKDTTYPPSGEVLSVDPDGFSGVEHGTATVNGEGDVVFTPADDWHGVETFTYTVKDARGGSATADVTVTISAVNDLPDAVNNSYTIDEDAQDEWMFTVLANDTDADKTSGVDPTETMTIVSVAGVDAAMCTVDIVDGTKILFNPIEHWNGTTTFTYTIEDLSEATATATVTVNINQVNDNPEAVDDTGSAREDNAATIDVLNNDTDKDQDTDLNKDTTYPPSGEVLSVDPDGFSGVEHGTATVNGEGDVVFTPADDWHGVETFTYTVKDARGGSATADVTVTITAVNDLPVAKDDTYTIDEDAQDEWTFTVLSNDTDADKTSGVDPTETMTIVSVAGVDTDVCTVDIVDDTQILFNPIEHWNGTTTFTYTIEDLSEATATATVTVNINQVNDNPEAVDDTGSAQEDNAAMIDVLNNDTDKDQDTDLNKDTTYPPSGEVLSVDPDGFSGVEHGTATVNGEGDVVFTPADDWHGVETFTYTVKDARGGSATADVTVTISAVNDLPDAVNNSYTIDEDAQDEWMFTVLANDTDADKTSGVDPTETMTIVSVAGVDAAMCTVDIVDGTKILFNPIADWNGTTTFTYTIEDLSGATDTATVTVNIDQVNDGPVAANDTGSADEDNAAIIDVLANDTDIDQDTTLNKDGDYPPADEKLSVVDPDGFSGVDNGTAGVNTDGDVVFTPAANWHGVETFTYTVKDAHGGSDTASVTVTINAVNDAPQIGTNTGMTVNEGDSKTILKSMLDEDDIDDSGEGIIYELTDLPDNGTLYLDGDEILEGGSFTQADIDAGLVSYTHDGSETTSDSFGFKLTDGKEDGAEGVDGIFEINVIPVNDPPVLEANTGITLDEGAQSDITTSELDHSDADNTDSELTYKITVNVAHGTLYKDTQALALNDTFTQQDLADDSISYRHDGGETNADSFTFVLSDNDVSLESKVFAITINSVNDEPTVDTNEGMTLNEGATKAIDKDMLETQDTDNTEAELKYTITSDTVNGTMYLDDAALGEDDTFTQADINSGLVTYKHDGSETTTDSFDFTVNDESIEGGKTGTFNITIIPVNDPPVLEVNAGITLDEGAKSDITTTELDHSDVDNTDSEIVYTISAGVENGILYKNTEPLGAGDEFTQKDIEDGIISYEHDNGESRTDKFTFIVSDNDVSLELQTFEITITGVNDTPVLDVNTGMTLNEGATKDVAKSMLESQDPDSGADKIIYKITSETENGTMYLDDEVLGENDAFTQADINSGLVKYTHDGSETTADSFDFTVDDESGEGGDSGTFEITIIPVNDPPETPVVKTPESDDYYKDGQTIHVTWSEPSDPENDELTYKLEFFDGIKWSVLAENLSVLEYDHVLGTTQLHTAKAKYRVTANDGELSSNAGQGYAFIIDNNSPMDVAVSIKSLTGAIIAQDSWANGAKITVSGGYDLLEIRYYLSIDGADAKEVGAGEITSITQNGEHTIIVTAKDQLDNEAVVGTYTFKIDTLAPLKPKVIFSPSDYTDGNVAVSFSFYEDPGGSGNNTITLPNSTSKSVNNSVTWTAVGNGTYKMAITDVAGNRTDFTITIDWIDTSVPRISLNQNGYQLGTWTNKNINAELIYYDSDSGIYNKDYYIGSTASDSPSWRDYTATVSFAQDGTYYLFGLAQDRAGNQVKEVFGEFKIDKTAPLLTIVENQDGTYTIRCTDALSGVKSIVLSDGTILSVRESQTWEPEFYGDYEITATDNAGNTSTVSGTIEEPEEESETPGDGTDEEDITPPEVDEEEVKVDETKKTAQVSIKVSDTESGVEMIILENGEVYYSEEILLSEVPYGVFKYKVVDKAGNVTEHTIIVGDQEAVEPMFTAWEIALIAGLGLLGILLILLLLSWNVKAVLYGYAEDGSLKETTQKWLRLRRKNNDKELFVKAKNKKNLRILTAELTLKKGLTKKMYTKTIVFEVEGINAINLTVPEDTDGKFEYTHTQK